MQQAAIIAGFQTC